MNPEYVKDVRRFASAGRITDDSGKKSNNSHDEDFAPTNFRTDGRGNIEKSPLVYRKLCIARVERNLRGHFGRRVWHDERGERRLGQTPCDTCAKRSPGIYEACNNIISERIGSSPAIKAAFEAWADACGKESGPRCFTGSRGKLWHALLQSIIDHGGWTNVNEDQVKIEALRLREVARRKRNHKAKARRKRDRDARRGISAQPTAEYLRALQVERDRRASILKGFGQLSGRSKRDMLWLKLPDTSCERIADVWQTRELQSHCAERVTGRSIAERMTRAGRDYGLSLGSLTTRVHEDLKRIAKLEDDRAGAPLWTAWHYDDQ